MPREAKDKIYKEMKFLNIQTLLEASDEAQSKFVSQQRFILFCLDVLKLPRYAPFVGKGMEDPSQRLSLLIVIYITELSST
jgi:hypothetical protein